MRKPLLKMYHELKESGSTSDWPLLLANTMHKTLLEKFKGVNSPWKSYTWQSELSDFRNADRVILDEAPDLIEVAEDGQYADSTFKDYRYQIQLSTFGRTFSVGRRAIINDDLEALRRHPMKFGRSAARTLVKRIVSGIEGDGLMYDNKSMFAVRTVLNYSNTSLANTAAGIAAVSAGMTAIEKATDETGEKMGLQAKFLVVPPDLEDTALRIVQGQSFIPVSTDGGTQQVGKATRLEVLVEPFFTSSTGWYVMADPMDAPVIEVGFLDGKDTPDLLAKKADTVSIAGGGEDEWGYDFDELFFKVRYDFAVARGMYQGIFRGKA